MAPYVKLWMIFMLTVCINAVSYTNNVEYEDNLIEDPQPYREDEDNIMDIEDYVLLKKKDDKNKKPTISEDAIFLPHEKYCQYFYVFDGKDAFVFSCAKGYRFDAKKLQCQKSNSVDCGKRKKNLDSSEERHVGHIHYKCPKWKGDYAHEHYCHLYYRCQTKKPELYMCPPGMLFNSNNGKCEYRKSVDCGKKVDPYDDNDSSEDVVPDPDEEIESCPESSGVYPHPKLCNKFIRCWFGLGDVYVCPKGTLFDTDLKKCRSEESVFCEDRIDPNGYDDEVAAHLFDDYPDYNCKVSKGRFPHEDCEKFYECRLGDAKVYICPSFYLYDSNLKTCRKETEVVCEREVIEEKDEDFICPAREGTFKDETNCGYFYKCRNGKAKHLKCEEGELFDTDWKSCDDEEMVTCEDRILPGDDPEEDEDENVVDPNPNYVCNKRHGRFTHEEICNYYYHCKDGKSRVRNCRRGQYYDSYRRNCYEDVDCGNRKPKEEEVTPTPKTREFVCPSKYGKYPHSKNCAAYYNCERGKYKVKYCSEGKLYDEKLRGCVAEEKVSCGDRIHPDMDPDEPSDEIIDQNPRFTCDRNYGRYEHEQFCDWYYNCHGRKASLRQCRSGKYYDTKKRRCIDSEDVSCGRRKKPEERDRTTATTEIQEEITTTVLPTTPKEFECPKKDGKFPHERDCSKFYDCKKWNHKIQSCSKDKLFDEKRGRCEPSEHVTCGNRIHPDMDPDEPEDEVVDPNPDYKCKKNHARVYHDEYCHWYYNCHDKKATVRKCKKGKYFDYYKSKCVNAKDVKCFDRKEPEEEPETTVVPTTTEISTTTTDEPTTTPEIPSTTLEVISTTIEEETTILPITPKEFECPKKDGKFPHERDCSKFYDCKKGNYKIHNCPKKDLFDEDRGRCEPSEHVTCGNRIHPDMDPDEPEDEVVDPNPDYKCKKNHARVYHEEYCNWYYNCHDKKATVRKCRKGKYFDYYKRKCVNAKDVICFDRKEPEEEPESTVVPTTAEISTTTTNEQTTTPEILSTTLEVISTTVEEETTREKMREETTFPSTPSTTLGTSETEISTLLTESTPSEITTLVNVSTTTVTPPTTPTINDISTSSETSQTLEEKVTGDITITSSEAPETTLGNRSTESETTPTPEAKITDDITTSTESPETTLENRSTGTETTPTPEGRITDDVTTSTESPETTLENKSTGSEATPTLEEKITEDITLTDFSTQTPATVEDKTNPPATVETLPSKGTTTSQSFTSETYPTIPPETTISEEDNPDKIVNENPDYDCHGNDGRFAHESYCHYYYSCKDNKPTLRECPEGQAFDIERGYCEDWYMVTCGDRLRPDELDPTFDDFQSTPYVKETSTSTPRETTTEGPPTTELPFECPTAEGFYPHERNCAKYHVCTGGVSETKTCPKGQLYDVDKNACNEEQETNCGKRIHPNDDPDNPNKIPDKVIDPNPGFNCTDRHGCFTHEVFCKWYYYCHDNRPEVRECSGDRYFDTVRNKCLEWWMVICDERIPDPQLTTVHPTENDISTKESKETGLTENEGIGSTESDKERTGATSSEHDVTGSSPGEGGTGTTSSKYDVTGTSPGGREGTESTGSDREGTGTTSSDSEVTGTSTGEREGTRNTRNDREETGSTRSDQGGTGSTRSDREGTGSTRSDQEETGSTESEREGTGTTSSDSEVTGTSTDGREGTTSTSSDREGTGSTRSDREGTGSTSSDREGTGSTRSDRERTGSTSSDREGTGSTISNREGTGSTRSDQEGTGSTSSNREGTGSTSINREGTGSTRSDQEGTESTRSDREGTGSTRSDRERTGSTENDREGTGITSSDHDVTGTSPGNREGTGSTRSDQEGTGSTSSDREGTGSTSSNREGTGRTRSDQEGTGSTRSDREVTGSTRSDRERTGSTENDREGTGITSSDHDVTGTSPGNREGTESTGSDRESTGTTSSDSEVTGTSTGEREETGNTRNDREGTGSTRSDKEGTGSTSSDREGTGSTRSDRERTGSTRSDKEGTGSTRSDQEGTGSTGNDREGTGTTESDREGTGTTSSDSEVTGTATNGREGTISTRSEQEGTGSTRSDREGTGSTSSNREGTGSTRSDREGTGSTRRDREGTGVTSSDNDVTGTSPKGREGTGIPTLPTSTGIDTTTEIPIKEECKEEDGDFHHPEDCRMYYTCKDGEYQLNECPSGMLFDNTLRICANEDKVDCGSRYRPPTTTETEDDCDEWLRKHRTTPIENEVTTGTSEKGTTGLNEKGTGSTEITKENPNSKQTTENTSETLPDIATTEKDETASTNDQTEGHTKDETSNKTGTGDEITSPDSVSTNDDDKELTASENIGSTATSDETGTTKDSTRSSDFVDVSFNTDTTSYNTGSSEFVTKDVSFNTDTTRDNTGSSDFVTKDVSFNTDTTSYNTGSSEFVTKDVSFNTDTTRDNTGSSDFVTKDVSFNTDTTSYNTGSSEFVTKDVSFNTDTTRDNTGSSDFVTKDVSFNTDTTSYNTGSSEFVTKDVSFNTDTTSYSTDSSDFMTNDVSLSTEDGKTKSTDIDTGDTQPSQNPETDITNKESTNTGSTTFNPRQSTDPSNTQETTPTDDQGTTPTSFKTDPTNDVSSEESTISETVSTTASTSGTDLVSTESSVTEEISLVPETQSTEHDATEDNTKSSETTKDISEVSLDHTGSTLKGTTDNQPVTQSKITDSSTDLTESTDSNSGETEKDVIDGSTKYTDVTTLSTTSSDAGKETSENPQSEKTTEQSKPSVATEGITNTDVTKIETQETESSQTDIVNTKITEENTNSDKTPIAASTTDGENGNTDDETGTTEISQNPQTDITGKVTGATEITKNSSEDSTISPTQDGTTENEQVTEISSTSDDRGNSDSTKDDGMTATDITTGTTDENDVTHEHTTMHPCLTHTHSTPLPTGPPKTDCEEDDIECIKKETGDVSKWFKCPKKRGDFPHPVTKRLFIECRHWKPKVKKCGRNRIFSVKSMSCVSIK